MKKTLNGLIIAALFLVVGITNTQGQTWCDANKLTSVDDLKKDHRVIDARPNAINSVTGKMAFKKKAQVAIVNMNPFMFKYQVKVDQTEIKETAVLDFLKLLGAPISDLAEIAAFRAVAKSADDESLSGGDLERLTALTGGPPFTAGVALPALPLAAPVVAPPAAPGAPCAAPVEANQALTYLAQTRDEVLILRAKVEANLDQLTAAYAAARGPYLANQENLYSPSSDAAMICTAANNLMGGFLNSADPLHRRATYPTRDKINKLKTAIARLDSLIRELDKSATAFKSDDGFKDCQARANGFNYADSLNRLAAELSVVRAAFERRAGALSNETKAYDFLVKTIRTFATDNGAGVITAGAGPGMQLLQKEFEIVGEYDISALDIQLASTDLQPLKPDNLEEIDSFRASVRQANGVPSGYGSFSTQFINGVPVQTVGDIGDQTASATATSNAMRVQTVRTVNSFAAEESGDDKPAPAARKANATIGAHRFELSAGMAFSTLDRREFNSVLGFARNQAGVIVGDDGNPTDKPELTKIVGVTESTKQRFSPIVMLNTRLTNNPTYNLFFSVGVTAKNSSNGVDVEYLLGPSFNFLNKNAFFTFGAYAGRQQKLTGDLFVGAKLPGDDVSIRKEYRWAPAFSFTYRIPIKSDSGK